MRLIIGASSRVAQRFVAFTPDVPTVMAGREQVAEWLGPDGSEALEGFLQNSGSAVNDVHIFAGVTDPKTAVDIIDAVNVRLPELVLAAAEVHGFAVTTYGTALEALSPAPNAYVESKQQVARLVEATRDRGVDAQHIRFHTVFGATTPQPHMFLGQILTALVSGDDFHMSSGTQFREYQHVDDVVASIDVLMSNRDSASVTISHGAPIQLGALARSIFESFDRLDSLKIGSIPDQVPDVTAPLGGKSPELADLDFRDTIPAVVAYMHDAVTASRGSKE